MKFAFSITGVTSQMANVEELKVDVEYTVEELIAVVSAWEKILPSIIAFAEKQNEKDLVARSNAEFHEHEMRGRNPDAPF